MVFAANANESSANTFEAFEARAKQDGSATNITGSSGTGKNGAGAVRLGGTGVIPIVFAALLLGLTLWNLSIPLISMTAMELRSTTWLQLV
jgi:hypothetical protein